MGLDEIGVYFDTPTAVAPVCHADKEASAGPSHGP
jgi:hypothetical protein